MPPKSRDFRKVLVLLLYDEEGADRESETNVRFRTIWARTFGREDPHKKHITAIVIIRALRGRDFAWVFAAIRELRALEVAPWSSIFLKKRDELFF